MVEIRRKAHKMRWGSQEINVKACLLNIGIVAVATEGKVFLSETRVGSRIALVSDRYERRSAADKLSPITLLWDLLRSASLVQLSSFHSCHRLKQRSFESLVRAIIYEEGRKQKWRREREVKRRRERVRASWINYGSRRLPVHVWSCCEKSVAIETAIYSGVETKETKLLQAEMEERSRRWLIEWGWYSVGKQLEALQERKMCLERHEKRRRIVF